MSINILHTADLHLGSRMRSLGRAAPDFQEALIQSFDNLLQQAEKREIDLFLIAGDFLEMTEIEDRELNRICDLLARERSFPVLIVAGNHDPYSSASPYATIFPEIPRLYVFPAGEIVRLDFPKLDTSVWGVSFSTLYQKTTLLPIPGTETTVLTYDGNDFLNKTKQADSLLSNKIGLIHGEYISGRNVASAYNPLASQEIIESGLDYLALGHTHKPSAIPASNQIDRHSTLALYPGSPQGLSFNEAGIRHALLVELNNSEVLGVLPLLSASRLFVELDIELEGSESDQEIIDLILAKAKNVDSDNYKRYFYKIRLKGEAPTALNVKRLAASLRGKIVHVSLLDELRLAENINELAEEQTLRGLYVRKIQKALEENKSLAEKIDLQQALRLGLSAFRGEELEDVY
ncbi:MAG: DNA repair exonuclease [Fastidiosipila sp.]|nr:DNA repair exonuclease [Fastidiosipila sp.]